MSKDKETADNTPKFAGIEIPPELNQLHFLFLFFCTMLGGIYLNVSVIVQPAFLVDIIKIDQSYTGSMNAFLQNMSQVATLALVAYFGVLSDRVGRKKLAVLGFILIGLFYYLLTLSNEIAAALNLSADISAKICATLSFAPSKAAEFTAYAPGLLVMYLMRLGMGIGIILTYPQFITMAADYTYEKDRGKGMAMNGVMIGVASMLVFAAFSPIMKKIDVVPFIYLLIGIAALGALLTGLFTKDRMPEVSAEKMGLRKILAVAGKNLPVRVAYYCSLITRADMPVFATLFLAWGVKYGAEIGMASKAATLKASFPMMGAALVTFVAFPVIGVLLDKKGRIPVIIFCNLMLGAGMIIAAVSPHPFHWLVYLGSALIGGGMAGAIAGANALCADNSPKAILGSIMGGLNTMQPIGILFFLAVGGYLFDKFGPGYALGFKGIASVLLGVWMFIRKDSINKAIEEIKAGNQPNK